ncbi:MAG: PA14 domain-containing protein [Planctomycetota bacterium]
MYSRHEDANLGSPPYPYPGWENIYFVGNPEVGTATDSLVRGKTYYWCVDETDIWGNTFPFDPADNIWVFTVLSFYATEPDPPNKAIYIDPDVLLSWRGGYQVDDHDVYFGTSWEDVNNADEFDLTGVYKGWGKDPNWQCSGLPVDTRIYWRIDQVQGRSFPGTGTIYKGPVWEFTTRGANPGLAGEYYHHSGGASPAGFESKVLVRIDPNVNFGWGNGSPPGVRVDDFSVRWTGKISNRRWCTAVGGWPAHH